MLRALCTVTRFALPSRGSGPEAPPRPAPRHERRKEGSGLRQWLAASWRAACPGAAMTSSSAPSRPSRRSLTILENGGRPCPQTTGGGTARGNARGKRGHKLQYFTHKFYFLRHRDVVLDHDRAFNADGILRFSFLVSRRGFDSVTFMLLSSNKHVRGQVDNLRF